MWKNASGYKAQLNAAIHSSLEEIFHQKIRTEKDAKKLLWKTALALIMTIGLNFMCNTHIVPYFCEIRAVISMMALSLLIIISRKWVNTKKLFHDFLHPIVTIAFWVLPVVIALIFSLREGMDAVVDILLLAWFAFFVLINVNFRNLAFRTPTPKVRIPEIPEFEEFYAQWLAINTDIFFGVILMIFIFATLIAGNGEDLLIGWLVTQIKRSD